MNYEEIYKLAKSEAEWLRYYAYYETRDKELFLDAEFYGRLVSIGYTKRVQSLEMRCTRAFLTAAVPMLTAKPEDIVPVSGPGDHCRNKYTPLEYVIGTRSEGFKDLILIINPSYVFTEDLFKEASERFGETLKNLGNE